MECDELGPWPMRNKLRKLFIRLILYTHKDKNKKQAQFELALNRYLLTAITWEFIVNEE